VRGILTKKASNCQGITCAGMLGAPSVELLTDVRAQWLDGQEFVLSCWALHVWDHV